MALQATNNTRTTQYKRCLQKSGLDWQPKNNIELYKKKLKKERNSIKLYGIQKKQCRSTGRDGLLCKVNLTCYRIYLVTPQPIRELVVSMWAIQM